MTTTQNIVGWSLLAAIVIFGTYGVVQEVQAGNFRYVRNTTYVEECGACHFAYPPQLLPQSV